ncbi:MAG: hypothetical protein R2774_00385 [Saprospiraceae bacterium]
MGSKIESFYFPIRNYLKIQENIHLVLLLLLIFAVLPFIFLATCNHPLGMHEWDWITNLRGFTSKMTFWEEQKYYFNNVMGRYSSTWISSLSDNLYTLFTFKLFFILNILLSLMFIGIAVKVLLGFNHIPLIISTTSILWLSWISGISGVQDTLYMLTSVHTYLLGFYSLVLVLYCWYICLSSSHNYNLYWKSILIILSIFTIGTNEISLIYMVITSGFLLYNYNSKKYKLFLVTLIIISLGFALFSILSPANLLRKSQYASDYSFLNLVLLSISTSIFDVISWVVNGQLFFGSCLYLYLIKNIDTSQIKRIPILYFIVLVMILIFASHFLIIFGTNGLSIAERVVDLIYIHFLLIWFYALTVYCNYPSYGFFNFKNNQITNSFKTIFFIYYFLILFSSGISINRENKSFNNFFSLIDVNSNIGEAWLLILNGSAFQYDNSMYLQYEKLRKCDSDTCYLTKPVMSPKFLYFNLSDRRNTNSGDPFIGYYFNPNIRVVKYSDNQN